jgi:chemotaxis protein methyltransferase CheR
MAPEDRLWVYLSDNTGVKVPEDQNYFFESRLRRIIMTSDSKDLNGLVNRILRPGVEAEELRNQVVDALMTHETSFFRNPEVFEKLETEIIPDLLKLVTPPSELRIWSAASSTGQEAVSTSILMQEVAPHRPYSILGSDIGVGTVNKASTGKYSVLETNRGLSASRLHQWFAKEGVAFKVHPTIRRSITYRVHNLLEPLTGYLPFHLVMLRNVLVYFDEQSRQQAFKHIARVTMPGSVVVLGTGEQLLNVPDQLFTRHVDRRVAWLRRK